jgi:hypothetical protein
MRQKTIIYNQPITRMIVNPRVKFLDMRQIPSLRNINPRKTAITDIVLFETDLPKCLELPDAGQDNPYHLFFYMIARFYFFDNKSQPVYYYYPKKECYLVEKGLELLPSYFHRFLEKGTGREDVLLPGLNWDVDCIHEEWIYTYVRDLYEPLWRSVPEPSFAKIYITRRSAAKRRVLNEEDLLISLKDRGYSVYELELLTFEDQIRLFRSAKTVIGPHGAGLTWILFCRPSTAVIEICPTLQKYRHFIHISVTCGLRHCVYDYCDFEGDNIRLKNKEHFLKAIELF